MRQKDNKIYFGPSLDKIVEKSQNLKVAYKSELNFGDFLIVSTKNSSYHINVLGYDSYIVTGGWFSRKGRSPIKTTIAGCTWGGHVLKTDIIAACGLRLEFDNHVVTSKIKKIILFRGRGQN